MRRAASAWLTLSRGARSRASRRSTPASRRTSPASRRPPPRKAASAAPISLVETWTDAQANSPEALRELYGQVRSWLPDLAPAQLVGLATEFCAAGQRAPMLYDAIAETAEPRLARFSSTELSTLLYAFAQVGHHEARSLFHGGGAALSGKLRQCELQDLSTAMWASAVADVNCPALLGSDAFAERIGGVKRKLEREASEGPSSYAVTIGYDLNRMHQWQLWREERLLRGDAAAGGDLPGALREACLSSFASNEGRPSFLQENVGDALRVAGLDPRSERVVCQGYSIDMVVDVDGVPVAVEVRALLS